MIRYFRINDPYRLIGLLVMLCVLYLPLWLDPPALTTVELKSMVVGEKVSEGFTLYSELIDATPPLASWFYGFCNWLFGRSLMARHILAFVILFFQSAFISVLFIDKKAFTENTYLPSLIFSVLTLVAFDVASLTADLAAFGFLLLALNSIFKQIEFREQRDETIMNMGIYLSAASLFTFSYVLFLPCSALLLLLFTRTSIRQYLLLLFGFLLPHVLLLTVYFLHDNQIDLIHRYYQFNFSLARSTLLPINTLLILCSIPLFYLLVSVVILNRNARLTKYQSQLLQAMILWFLFALIHAWFSPDLRAQTLLPIAPAVSFLLTHFFLLIRRKHYTELNAWIFILGIVATAYLARYSVLPVTWTFLHVPATSHSVSGKKVLVLGNDPGIWLKNSPSPPFINWELSRSIFESPDEYSHVLLVNKLFRDDAPSIIIDPEEKMQPFFNRIPALSKRYKKSDNGYWTAISN